MATNAANRYKSTKSNLSQSSSLFDSANGYFSELRFKAANALTSSLPEDERNDLLQKLEPKLRPNEEEESTVPQISIAEAVAAARAQEAAIQSEKWENEKDKLLADAEQAARSRVESDIAIQRRKLMFEKWKQDVEKNLEEEKPQTASTEEENVGTHPVLGPIVMDLGHKRIHIVSAKDLASIPVWKKQRVYRHLRAQSMASDKIKSLHLGLPGIIGIYEVGLSK